MPSRKFWSCLIPVYLVGLAVLGAYFRNALNTDAVAYLRIASYYAAGNLALAVSGYWGPLLSWLMALPIKLGLPDLAVARGVMGFSALVFLTGSVAVYRAFKLPEKWVATGGILTSSCALYWSVRFMTPDLLLSGLIALAMSFSIREDSHESARNGIWAGILWGLAYLAKAVAFPLAILTTLIFGGLALRKKQPERYVCLRKTALTLACFGLIAGPWVLILSHKYSYPTFSTSARISHAITGPSDLERYHPFATTFHRPEPGRVTS